MGRAEELASDLHTCMPIHRWRRTRPRRRSWQRYRRCFIVAVHVADVVVTGHRAFGALISASMTRRRGAVVLRANLTRSTVASLFEDK